MMIIPVFAYPNVGVVLSETCLIMLKNQMETTCPRYNDLVQLDNSITSVSGGFSVDENGLMFRDDAQMKNSWRLYDYDDQFRIFVDPPQGHAERLRLITIHPNFDTYIDPVTSSVPDTWGYVKNERFSYLQNKTITTETFQIIEPAHRILYHDRFVDKNCRTSTVNAENWKMLVPDTVFYMINDCSETKTTINHIEKIYYNKTDFDATETRQYQHESWLEHISEFCIFKYKAC